MLKYGARRMVSDLEVGDIFARRRFSINGETTRYETTLFRIIELDFPVGGLESIPYHRTYRADILTARGRVLAEAHSGAIPLDEDVRLVTI